MIRRLRDDGRAVLPGWLAARVLVLLGWVAAVVWTEVARDGERSLAMTQGLFGWDGVFYRGLAENGYLREPLEAVRFFPLFPLAGRALGVLVGSPALALLLIANVGALLGAALVRRLGIESGLSAAAATRAGWLLSLAPPAFVLVWGYAEGLFIVLAAGTLLAQRRQRWWWAAALGAAAALTRPTGVLLSLAAAVEGARGLRRLEPRDLPARLAAIVGPVLGAASFLWWVGREYGDAELPIRLQDGLRRGVENPLVRVAEAGVDLARFDVHGLHFPFGIAMIVLALVAARRLPGSLALYSAASVAVALAAANLNSSERYALGAVPLALAAALVTEDRRWRTPTLVLSGAGLVGLTTLAWLAIYVP